MGTVADRIAKNHVVQPDGCWRWNLSIRPDGYGQIWTGNTVRLTHRVSYEIHVGPIPEGLVLDHLCRNRACINPEHLEVVTNEENIRRGQGPSALNARKTHCNQGHELDDANTYTTPGGTRQCRTCNRIRDRERVPRRRAS